MELGKPIAVGNTAKVYLVDGKVVKIFNDYFPDGEAEYEANKQRYAYSCGLKVPMIYDVTRIDGRQAILMEYVCGETLGEKINKNRSKTEQYMNLSVDIQLSIHKCKAEKLESMDKRLYNGLIRAKQLDERQKNILLERMQKIEYEKRLCHGDYHCFNVIKNDDDIMIIDWVDASAGDPRADACRSYLLYLMYSIDLAKPYIEAYCNKSGYSESEILQWLPILAGARLRENVSLEEEKKIMDIVSRYCE